jgi:heat shock protein 1/8
MEEAVADKNLIQTSDEDRPEHVSTPDMSDNNDDISESDSESESDSDVMEFLQDTYDSKAVVEEEDTKAPIVLGIDLGTTNSCISVWRNNNCEIIPDEYGNKTVPSYVAYTNVNRYVGIDAKKQKDINTENVFYEVKRLIGRNYYDKDVSNAQEMLSYSIVKHNGTGIGLQSNVMNNKIFSPEEISAVILSKLKRMAEKYLKREVEDVVITVPAKFNDTQRQATKNAATIAGLNCLRVFHEPTAAALAYGMMERSMHKSEIVQKKKTDKHDSDSDSDSSSDSDSEIEGMTIMVYDFGGGTLDVSIVDVVDGSFDVMGFAGNSYFGGKDFDDRLMTFCITKFTRQYYKKGGFDTKAVPRISLQKLRTQCEQAKKILSTNTAAFIAVESFYGDKDLFVKIKRSQFEDLCRDLFILCMYSVDEILAECGFEDTDIDEVILVGGMTRMPHIRKMLNDRFRDPKGDTRVNCSINPDEAISVGAAIQGHMIATQSDAFEKNLRLMDVTPLTLGVEVMGGIMDIVVERNTPIPCEVSRLYSTDTDEVESVNIKVYEGERRLTEFNTKIGEFELCNIPKYPRGIPEIEITFKIDSNGIVTVTAQEEETKERNEITVNSNKAGLNSDQIAQLVEESRDQEMMDEVHRVKKGCHYELHDLCSNVISNINNEEFKLTERDVKTISEDVENIRAWLAEKRYDDRSIDEYEEALDKMKRKYGVLIIHGKVEKNDGIKAADSHINATTVYGAEDDEMEEELVQAFEKVKNEEVGIDDGMTDTEAAELKELRSNLYELCETMMGILHSGHLHIETQNKEGLEEIINDILIWYSSCNKPTRNDYVDKIDEINRLCDELCEEYDKEGKELFVANDVFSENERPSEKLEKLCLTVLSMSERNLILGDKARINLLCVKARRNVDMVARYAVKKEVEGRGDKFEDNDDETSDDSTYLSKEKRTEYLSLSDEQFEERCAELIDEFNEACNAVYNTASAFNIKKHQVVPTVTNVVDYKDIKEDSVVKNQFDAPVSEENRGTSVLDIIRWKQNQMMDQLIEDQIAEEDDSGDNQDEEAVKIDTEKEETDTDFRHTDKHREFIN